jgi:hypothetical protein
MAPAAGEELAQIKEGLRRCFAEVGRSFTYFSLLGSGDIFSMQLNEYSDFLDLCGRGLHSSTFHLNLSRLCHSKYTLNPP